MCLYGLAMCIINVCQCVCYKSTSIFSIAMYSHIAIRCIGQDVTHNNAHTNTYIQHLYITHAFCPTHPQGHFDPQQLLLSGCLWMLNEATALAVLQAPSLNATLTGRLHSIEGVAVPWVGISWFRLTHSIRFQARLRSRH
jgi:hypothetical protein